MRTNSFLALVLLILSSAALSAQARELKIGGMFDLSSSGQLWGVAERDGMLLAIEDFSAAHPQFKIISTLEDSAYSNTRSVSAFQKLVNMQGLRVIVGPTWETFLAVVPLCERQKIVCLAPSYSSPDLVGKKFSFGLWYDNRGYVEALEPTLKLVSGKIGVIAAQGPYYDLLLEELSKKVPADRLTVERVAPDEQNLRPILQRLDGRGISALILYMSNGPMQSALRAVAELKLSRLKLMSDDAVLYLDPPLKGLNLSITITEPLLDQKLADSFGGKFKKRFGRKPDAPSGAVAYDATVILLACMQNESEQEKIAACIAATKSYSGYSGALDFGNNNQVQGRTFVSREVHLD